MCYVDMVIIPHWIKK